MNKSRRDFLKKGFGATLFLGSSFFGLKKGLLATEEANATEKEISLSNLVVAVKGGSYEKRLDEALSPFGGIKRWVKQGSKVLVKPNIGWNVKPEGSANTHPRLVQRIVEHCLSAGAKEVVCFDHTCDVWRAAYENSGIEEAVKNSGGKMIPGNSESYYEKKTIAGASTLKEVSIHGYYMEADVIINVPILKSHSGAAMTCALKNLMGVVWNRGFYHTHGLDECIAEFALLRKPTLNVVDAGVVMKTGGPRGNPSSLFEKLDLVIVSEDPVACDTLSAIALGKNPDQIGYITLAAQLGLGVKDKDKLKIERISL